MSRFRGPPRTDFRGPPHPLLGDAPYRLVREAAQDLLSILDVVESEQQTRVAVATRTAGLQPVRLASVPTLQPINTTQQAGHAPQPVGMGSAPSSGSRKMEGFGSVPLRKGAPWRTAPFLRAAVAAMPVHGALPMAAPMENVCVCMRMAMEWTWPLLFSCAHEPAGGPAQSGCRALAEIRIGGELASVH